MAPSTDLVTRILERLGAQPTIATLVDVLVPEVADLCLVYQRMDERFQLVAYGHMDPDKSAALDQLATVHRPAIDDPRDPVASVARSGQGQVISWVTRQNIERASSDPRVHAIFDVVAPRNIVLVPMRDGAYVIIAAISDTPRKFFPDDLALLTELASKLAPIVR